MWEAWVAIGSLGAAVLILILLIVFTLVFQLWMLLDCVKRKFDSGSTQALWIIVILFFGPIGASVYYLAVKRT